MHVTVMAINKLSVFCTVNAACQSFTFYPPIKALSSNPSNELFVLNQTGAYAYSEQANAVFSVDGIEYMTLNCAADCDDDRFEFFYGSLMDKTCSNIFNCAGYADPTLDDRSGIFYSLIDTNNVINPIT